MYVYVHICAYIYLCGKENVDVCACAYTRIPVQEGDVRIHVCLFLCICVQYTFLVGCVCAVGCISTHWLNLWRQILLSSYQAIFSLLAPLNSSDLCVLSGCLICVQHVTGRWSYLFVVFSTTTRSARDTSRFIEDSRSKHCHVTGGRYRTSFDRFRLNMTGNN